MNEENFGYYTDLHRNNNIGYYTDQIEYIYIDKRDFRIMFFVTSLR